MKTACRIVALLALTTLGSACRAPQPPPTDKPPEPQAAATADNAMRTPLQKARAEEQQMQGGAGHARQAGA